MKPPSHWQRFCGRMARLWRDDPCAAVLESICWLFYGAAILFCLLVTISDVFTYGL